PVGATDHDGARLVRRHDAQPGARPDRPHRGLGRIQDQYGRAAGRGPAEARPTGADRGSDLWRRLHRLWIGQRSQLLGDAGDRAAGRAGGPVDRQASPGGCGGAQVRLHPGGPASGRHPDRHRRAACRPAGGGGRGLCRDLGAGVRGPVEGPAGALLRRALLFRLGADDGCGSDRTTRRGA
uniref:NADH-ubiquinone oxidoreductase chain J n=1 Tax=Parastrongyloides trichosuri TaxID=131310 RepID=A0A0N5A621_PARTI